MLFRVTAAVIVLTLMAPRGDRGTASGLSCWSCTNWDNASKCLDPDPTVDYLKHISVQQCDLKLEVGKKIAHCLTEILYECQPTLFKDKFDLVGNGGAVTKRWVRLGCAYINVNLEPLKSHYACNWQRERRGGRDLYHNTSGFQVIGRSMIRRKCYCNDEDMCNFVKVEDSMCDNDCGPDCRQVSKDRCVPEGTDDIVEGVLQSRNRSRGKGNSNKAGGTGRGPSTDGPDRGPPGGYDGTDTDDGAWGGEDNYKGQDYNEKNQYSDWRRDVGDEYSAGYGSDAYGGGEGGGGAYANAGTEQDAACRCPDAEWPKSNERPKDYVPTKREWPDCGVSEGRMVPTMIGGRTYRHYWWHGVRKAIEISDSLNSSAAKQTVTVFVFLFLIIIAILR